MSESVQATHAHDFDFYVGTWMIHNRRLRKALAGCTEWYEFEAISKARPVLGGMGNFDEFDAPDVVVQNDPIDAVGREPGPVVRPADHHCLHHPAPASA